MEYVTCPLCSQPITIGQLRDSVFQGTDYGHPEYAYVRDQLIFTGCCNHILGRRFGCTAAGKRLAEDMPKTTYDP